MSRRSLILETVTRAAFDTIWVVSLYLLFAGHNQPGGGFIGGLVGGAALVLRYLSVGSRGVTDAVGVRFETLLGAGLVLAGGTGVAGWLFGTAFLESKKLEADLPLLGHVAATSVLIFDVGVYLVVVGLVLGALATLGGDRTEMVE